jgi:hypothetical protein
MNRGRVGEERGGKETDRCPLTDDTLATASDTIFDRLHYKDFPALHRACTILTVKSKDKKINVIF